MNTQMIPLNNLALLNVSGDDATKFLHAQFTNDLKNLDIDSWQYSGYCTPKGRLLAFMKITHVAENSYQLILPAEIATNILPRLRMFVMRDKVTVELQDALAITGIISATGELNGLTLEPEKENGKLINSDNIQLLTIDRDTGRYLHIGVKDSLPAVSNGDCDSIDAWTLAEIRQGIPAIVASTQEAYVPQMVNLDLIGAVNFKKGCYPGQEIVARVHYLGKIKQRMYVLEGSSDALAKPGDKIFIVGEDDKTAGTVVQSATNGSTLIIQAVLQTKVVDEKLALCLSNNDDAALTLGDQPYPVSETEKPE